jgi:hypothetical protein
MKQDTRNYGKFHQRFAKGGAVKEDEMGKDAEPEMGDSNYAFGGPVELQHHEQSETVQNDKGEWINVYGGTTPQAGKNIQLPDTPTYPTVDDAVNAAKKRSLDYGKEHEDE